MADLPGKAVNHLSQNNEKFLLSSPKFMIPHRLSPCTLVCHSCGALHWKQEATQDDLKKKDISYTMCCQKNKVTLPSFDPDALEFPPELKQLFVGKSERDHNFQDLTRMYNNTISFTSLGAKVDASTQGPFGINAFRISGALSHRISSIEPDKNKEPGFSQIFVVGDKGLDEASLRVSKAQGKSGDTGRGAALKASTVKFLMDRLNRYNPYAKLYRTSREVLSKTRSKTFKLQGVPRAGCDPKRYNEPTVNEVAVIVKGEGDIIQERQILLHRQDSKLIFISDMHSSYLPLRYPLFFPRGEQQWDDLYRASTSRVNNYKVGCLEWFSYLLFKRNFKFSAILAGRSLLQEFIVDGYVCVERGRLQYIRSHQVQLKADQYVRLVHSIENQKLLRGRSVILPATFIGGPRSMSQLYHDAMAICRRFGPPSLFITMTADPLWREILCELPAGDSSVDHPTIVTRVFHLKVEALIFQIVKMGRLGRVVAYLYTIEFQKRGLPHLHLIVTLCEKDRPKHPEDIDLLVSAEIPDKLEEPRLYALVQKFMLHGPCKGRACWHEKGFYLRRNDGVSVSKHTSTFNNGNIVPFNKFLTLMFECHINVEVPVNTTAIKYLYKYITKGHDRAYMAMNGVDGKTVYADETEKFVDGRYISAPEAAWRLFKFPLSDRFPAVTRLNLHEENEQLVYFRGSQGAEGQIASGSAATTTLTAYFQLNRDNVVGADEVSARTLLYEEIPKYFYWDKPSKSWRPRSRKEGAIGRMYSVAFTAGEKFYLRILLLHRAGCVSFLDLRTVDGVVADDYQGACNLLGLLVNDFLYEEVLREAATLRTGYQLTQFFALICVHSPPSDPSKLFNQHYLNFTDDTTRVSMDHRTSRQLKKKERRVLALFRLEGLLESIGASLATASLKVTQKERELLSELHEEATITESLPTISNRLASNVPRFNKSQKLFYNRIKRLLLNAKAEIFYLDGPGGTGKTFLLNTIIDYALTKAVPFISVASSGVAALLLKNGQTAHSAFKIPIDTAPNSECPIDEDTILATQLTASRLIIWDEIVTIHKNSIEAVDRTLMRLCNSSEPFGGKVVIFSGDFRQILPVVKYNEYPPAEKATIRSSPLWQAITCHKLTENMRLAAALKTNAASVNAGFAKALLLLGEGRRQKGDSAVIPLRNLCLRQFSDQVQMNMALIDFVYPELESVHSGSEASAITYLNERCILAPHNVDVRRINEDITTRLPGSTFTLTSIDTPDPDGFNSLPEECLNRLSPAGLPAHKIIVKVGMPIVVTRNMAIGKGVCNGSRLLLTAVQAGCLVGKLMAGPFAGNEVMLPRCKLQSKAGQKSGLSFYRHQFPIMPAYAMSINKSQGQTLGRVGVYLNSDVFSHGQLYVALSRVSDVSNLLVVNPSFRLGVLNVVKKSIFKKRKGL
ncbi:hypothetical protein MJO28_011140 [Puccinia striiformis f. sp. tritici]|uniref:Uncharacterized protein n=1 Tax=Puccinia striiformis f. sp. tritici TaxID=168172 RepID=A0ACC0E1P0_9BASI|nr:hypothetical protein MJO28_011140 [Puccinia striiformis f. sp. tritici]